MSDPLGALGGVMGGMLPYYRSNSTLADIPPVAYNGTVAGIYSPTAFTNLTYESRVEELSDKLRNLFQQPKTERQIALEELGLKSIDDGLEWLK